MNNPSLQILLPTYNGSRYLCLQLDSLVSQSYRSFEVLTYDDGSTDNSVIQVDNFGDKLAIERIPNAGNTNNGALKSFELLIRHSTADCIMFCDQDDIWERDKVELGIGALTDAIQKYGDIPIAVFSDAQIFSDVSEVTSSFLETAGFNQHALHDPYYLAFRNFAPGCTMTVNRKLLERAQPFSSVTYMHDWWLMLFASLSGKVVFVNKRPIRYRLHTSNTLGVAEDRPMHPLFSIASMLSPFKAHAVMQRLLPGLAQARRAFSRCNRTFHLPLFIVKLITGRYLAPGVSRYFKNAARYSWKRII